MESVIREVCVKHMKFIKAKDKEREVIKELFVNEFQNLFEIKKKSFLNVIGFLYTNNLIQKDKNKDKNKDKFNKDKFNKIKESSIELLEKILSGTFKIEDSTNLKNKFILYLLSTKYHSIKELEKITFRTNSELKFFLEDLSKAFNEKINEVNDKEKIQRLEEEVNKLRSSLILLESEKSDFEEENEMLKEKYEMQALIDIFKKMNSEEYDYLLDNFLKNNQMLKILKKDGFEVPVEVESMVISQKVFMKFLKKNQIKEIQKIGNLLDLSVEESNAYNYSGTEFFGEEIKNVIIETSGWKIGDIVISQPKVKEVINGEQK